MTQAAGTAIVMDLKTGPVVIALKPDLAPNHVARIVELASSGFYDGIVEKTLCEILIAHEARRQ